MVDAAGEPVRSPRSSHRAAVVKRQLRADRAAGREAWADEKRRNGLAQPEDVEDDTTTRRPFKRTMQHGPS